VNISNQQPTALILFIQTLALYKSFTCLLTYKQTPRASRSQFLMAEELPHILTPLKIDAVAVGHPFPENWGNQKIKLNTAAKL